MENDLESLASNPSTPAAELQRLAGDYSSLRPIIAMNPSAYPALLDWLGELQDPAVNLALEQRRAAIAASATTPQRVSVIASPAAPRTVSQAPARPQPLPQTSGAPQPWAQVGEPAPQAKERKVGVIVAWVAALVLLVAAAGLLTFVLLNKDDSPTTAASTQEETAVAEQAEEQEESQLVEKDEFQDQEQQEELPIRYPVPSSAISASNIVAPSGNIICRLGEEGVSCTILQYTFSDPTLSACAGSPVTLTTTDNFADVNCTNPQVGTTGATSLSYGDYATFGNGACLSDFSGMSCWDVRTGSSFAVAREGFVTGNQGSISPGQFWWN